MQKTAKILFPLAVPEAFDYLLAQGMRLKRGDFVYAPLGRQSRLGLVWEVGAPASIGKANLKTILEHKPCRPLNREILEFIDWVAKYNCAPAGLVLRMVLRSHKALEPSKLVSLYQKPDKTATNTKMSAAAKKVWALQNIWPARAADLAKAANVSASVIKNMHKNGLLIKKTMPQDAEFASPDPDYNGRGFELSADQQRAVQQLQEMVKTLGFGTALLDGVTGSGKTEVYLEAAASALKQGRQVLILVPEIALTQAGIERIEKRFGVEVASWHSAMGEAARRRVWREVHYGRCKIVVGARSGLFLPFADLGLIVVDEEHDGSFKQEEGVIYNARDMAVIRAKTAGANCILASATPSLESLMNARNGRYSHIILPERHGAAVMPEVDLVDLKEFPPQRGSFLSAPLIEGVKTALDMGDQALLYLNRRGYAPLIICRKCGERLKSPDTDSWLVEHRRSGRAICHQSGFSMPIPKTCPKCGSDDSLTSIGPGVERIAEEAQQLFKGARIEILSSDTANSPERIKATMAAMAAGEIDILIGTQMVVKGHNFPHLTFVGVVDGDLSLGGGDLRAGERTYQILVQVAGRAGRAEKPGRALIQTHQPEHEALQALQAGDRERFVAAELQMRQMLGLPPFGRLAAIIISAPEAKKADSFAREVLLAAPRTEGIEIFGPAEAPIAILRGRHRRRFLIRADMNKNLSAYMTSWRARVKIPPKTKFTIDIDPQGFM